MSYLLLQSLKFSCSNEDTNRTNLRVMLRGLNLGAVFEVITQSQAHSKHLILTSCHC